MLRLYGGRIFRVAGSSHESARRRGRLHPNRPKAGLPGAPVLRFTKEWESQARVPVPQGLIKQIRPGYPKDINIDRKQPLGVSLKGSSLVLLGAGQGEEPESSESSTRRRKF